MYETYVDIGDVQGIFPQQTLRGACKADEFGLHWPGIYWHCVLMEIDVPASFGSSEGLLSIGGDTFDFSELFEVGKGCFESLSKVYEKPIESNLEFELLCYLFSSFIYRPLMMLSEEGRCVTQDGKVVGQEDLEDISFHETIPRFFKRLWVDVDDGYKGLAEAYLNCRVIQAIDSVITQHCCKDTEATMYAMEEFYAYKNFLDWIDSINQMTHSHASRAAKARHAETDWIKGQVFEYYDQHKDEFKSLREAAKEIAKREPVKFRTIYDWLRGRA